MEKMYNALCDLRMEAKRRSNDMRLSEDERGRWKEMQERLKLALNGGYGTLATEAEPVFVVDHVSTSYGERPSDTTVIVGRTTCRAALTPGAKLYR